MKFVNSIAAIALSLSVGACAVTRGQESMGEYVSDAAITTELKTKYAADREVAATSIGVETMQGTVQLSGYAKSQAEKDKAAAIARSTKGVTTVRNNIVVRP